MQTILTQPMPPLPPCAADGLARRETALDPEALADERSRQIDEVAAWHQLAVQDGTAFSPRRLLRQRSGVQFGENPHDWSSMLRDMTRAPRETEEEKRTLMNKIAGEVVTFGINFGGVSELEGMPQFVQWQYASLFHEIRRTLRQKPTKPPKH